MSSTTPVHLHRRSLVRAARAHPVGMVWFGTVVFATGPVMVAATSLPGAVFSFWRLWLGVPLLGLATLVHVRSTHRRPKRAGWVWAARCGVAFAVHQVMFMTALQSTSVVDVTLMNTLAPVVVAALAAGLFGERPSAAFRLWSGLAIVGAAAVALAGSSGPDGDPAGMALAAGNVVFYALFFVWSKQAREEVDTTPFLFGATLVAAVGVSGWLLVSGQPVTPVSTHDLVLCLAVAALPGFAGHFSVTWALAWVPANVPPVIMLSIPVISGSLAWVVLGEAVTAAQLAGGVVTLAGVAGALRSPVTSTAIEAMTRAEET
ncbi:MAG: DMT family transporter [Acidimicrobiales bacterium]|jgi:drug/metabolite transporter (DMT)-like permease|nr:DMT family transporter [Acidimicrobiales bacterium]